MELVKRRRYNNSVKTFFCLLEDSKLKRSAGVANWSRLWKRLKEEVLRLL
jgi:hypothetical protein